MKIHRRAFFGEPYAVPSKPMLTVGATNDAPQKSDGSVSKALIITGLVGIAGIAIYVATSNETPERDSSGRFLRKGTGQKNTLRS